MSITTRAELITAIGDYLNNSDLAANASTFIQLAEAMFNRRIFVLNAQGTSTATAAASVSVPSDFNGIDAVYLADYGPLAQLGPDDFQKKFAEDTATGVPEYFMLTNGAIYLGPPPDDTYTVTLQYWKKIPALTEANTTNWLLSAHPDLYLFASLVHAELYGWNDDRLPVLKQAMDTVLSEIVVADSRVRHSGFVGDVAATYF